MELDLKRTNTLLNKGIWIYFARSTPKLCRFATDGAYEKELASMTERMSRPHLIGFMESLEGEWCGRSERRKVVDAAEFVKALPSGWKVELALRHRAGLPSIYCRSYVSPSGKHFKSCKDAAIYLRNQCLTDVASPFEEREMRQIDNDCHTVPKSADVNLLASGELYDVKVSTLIECSPCGVAFQDMRELEKHLAIFHKETTRRFDFPTGVRVLEKHADMDDDDEHEPQQNGQGSSSLQKAPEPQEPISMINEKFKTNCTWCNKEFLCEPVDNETMKDASGFMCPQCKDKLCGAFERSLLKSYKH
ncbi:hypothetical protein L1887_24627 [Cichorium endivia]|nr:hypothetical protein L1887_24627 [Cichorium endivia]